MSRELQGREEKEGGVLISLAPHALLTAVPAVVGNVNGHSSCQVAPSVALSLAGFPDYHSLHQPHKTYRCKGLPALVGLGMP